MNYLTYSHKLDTLKMYIENKWANTLQQLAEKLDVSERTVLRMVKQLKEQGTNIVYCKKEKVYKIFL